jgi:hypothetical protein
MSSLSQDLFAINQIAEHAGSEQEAWQKMYNTGGFSIDETAARRIMTDALEKRKKRKEKVQAFVVRALGRVIKADFKTAKKKFLDKGAEEADVDFYIADFKKLFNPAPRPCGFPGPGGNTCSSKTAQDPAPASGHPKEA